MSNKKLNNTESLKNQNSESKLIKSENFNIKNVEMSEREIIQQEIFDEITKDKSELIQPIYLRDKVIGKNKEVSGKNKEFLISEREIIQQEIFDENNLY